MAKDRILFITGASRSGTTLLSFVLRKQTDILGLRELQYFGEFCGPSQLGQSLTESQLLRAAAAIHARQRDGILEPQIGADDHRWAQSLLHSMPEHNRTGAGLFAAAVGKLGASAGKPIPCEQTPRNIFYAKQLLDTFEDAHVIHMMRDPRSVMASQKKRWQRRKLAAQTSAKSHLRSLQSWVNYHPYTSARLWTRASNAAHRLQGHPRFTIVRFEDLVGTPQATVEKLCRRIGVSFEPKMLDISQVNSSHVSSTRGQRQGWNTAAIDAWRQILTPTEISIAQRICGPLMRDFDYPPFADQSRRFFSASELRYRVTYIGHAIGVVLINPRRAWIQLQAAARKAH